MYGPILTRSNSLLKRNANCRFLNETVRPGTIKTTMGWILCGSLKSNDETLGKHDQAR